MLSGCPAKGSLCSFMVNWSGSASVQGTTSASFTDPLSIDLPLGWTYTLASQSVATVPEPSYLPLVIFAVSMWLLRSWHRRTRVARIAATAADTPATPRRGFGTLKVQLDFARRQCLCGIERIR